MGQFLSSQYGKNIRNVSRQNVIHSFAYILHSNKLHKYMKTRYFEKTLKQVNGRCKAPVAEKTAGCTGMSE